MSDAVPRPAPPGRAARQLALRVALPVGLVAFVLDLVLSLGALGAGLRDGVPEVGLLRLVALPLVAGFAAYVAVRRLLDRRLAHLHALLASFAPGAPPLPATGRPHGDELDGLVRAVRRTGQALTGEIAELRRLEHYRREFLGNVSHELKTPIFAIQGFAETLLDGALDDERVRRSFTEKILRNTHRLGLLTRDLTDLARIESGEMKMKAAPFHLDRLVRDVFETVQGLADERRVDLVLDAPEALPPALGDRERLRQVVTNLVENAVKYGHEGGTVTVRLAAEAERVVAAVEDDGPGIAPQHLPRLTERFYRVDRSRSRDAGGTGLGLAIVKHILAAHQSALAVESRVGEGSRFGFALPRAPGRRLADEAALPPRADVPSAPDEALPLP